MSETTDAVAQVRDTIVDLVDFAYQMGYHELGYNPIDALIAAVRTECAAKVRAIPNLAIDTERHPSLAGVDVDICHRSDVLAALEAQP